jgi:4-aminobutyrate aminotransferase
MEKQIRIRTTIPGPKSTSVLDKLKQKNGGWNIAYPFVHSSKGAGCYCTDIDGNTFLDFGSQIASNPLGYNHPALVRVSKQYAGRSPIKFAGQDFAVKEHLVLLDELLRIAPKKMNAAFLTNSGAEAVENALKISLRKQRSAKFGISFTGGFHGRTLGALSCTNSKAVQKKHYLGIDMRRLPFSEDAGTHLEQLLALEAAPADIGFVIVEPVQGEGGYHVASKKMMKDVRRITKQYGIPLIVDEVQSGMGRTGKWWAFEHYDIVPDVFSSAKALQVGATVAHKKFFPTEQGSISSTWGGGHILDLAMAVATIQTIKKDKLLLHNTKMGNYLRKGLLCLAAGHSTVQNIRGLGLMQAFDLPSKKMRDDFVLQMLKQGIILLGCGKEGVRLLPPYVVSPPDIDVFLEEMGKALRICSKRGRVHAGKICEYGMCAEAHS